jgi:phosphoadenosine phosphosulfate reductase
VGLQFQTHYRSALMERAEHLNREVQGRAASEILDLVLNGEFEGKAAIVSSFGAESAVLLKLARDVRPDVPVFFLNTHKHFTETLEYVDRLQDLLGLTNLTIVSPDPHHLAADDPNGTLHERDPDRCCYVRKTIPMVRHLNPFRVHITGRKRFQSNTRADLQPFEVQEKWLKVNPLVDWTVPDLSAFARRMNLPPHPLVAHGFKSIGCAPCTTRVAPDETDPRAGRWRGLEKDECGIHFVDGQAVRVASGL